MNRSGNQLFAGPSFAEDESGCVSGSYRFYLLQHHPQSLALTYDFFKVIFRSQLLLEIALFLPKLVASLEDSSKTMVNLDGSGDLARRLEKRFNISLFEGGLALAAYKQSTDHFTATVQRHPEPRLYAGLPVASGFPSFFPIDLTHQERFLVGEDPALGCALDGKHSLVERMSSRWAAKCHAAMVTGLLSVVLGRPGAVRTETFRVSRISKVRT